MDVLSMAARMAVSLVAVLGLMWLIARGVRRGQSRRAAAGEALEVLTRQPVGAKASVAVLRVGGRALVVGITEQSVSLLSEGSLAEIAPTAVVHPDAGLVREQIDLSALAVDQGTHRRSRNSSSTKELAATATERDGRAPAGYLTGSALSPSTWTGAVRVLQERSVRR